MELDTNINIIKNINAETPHIKYSPTPEILSLTCVIPKQNLSIYSYVNNDANKKDIFGASLCIEG